MSAVSIQQLVIVDLVAVIVGISDQHALVAKAFDITVAVADAEGNDAVIGLYLPGQ